MNKQFFFLSPVEVVKVTSQNLEEVAEWCGGSVQEAESRRVQGRMDKYVLVPTPSEKQISWAFPGMFITKRLVVTVKDELRATYAVFRRDYFEKNYFDTPKDAADKTWERAEVEKNRPKPKKTKKKAIPYTDLHLTQNMGEALLKAQQRAKELEKKLEDAGVAIPEDASLAETQVALVDLGEEIVEIIETPGGATIRQDLSIDSDPAEEFVIEVGSTEILEPLKWEHDHSYLKTCDSQLCTTDRYIDGLHYFTDAIGYAPDSETPTVWTNLEGDPIDAPPFVATKYPEVSKEELEGKTEAQIEMHINGVSDEPVGGVGAAMVAAYQNIGAPQNIRGL